jgi:hypothetical protein
MLALSGLPTFFPKLNEARIYTERMFHVMHLERLNDDDARQAIEKPLELSNSTLRFSAATIKNIVETSEGYPYFIQFICREVFDTWIGKIRSGVAPSRLFERFWKSSIKISSHQDGKDRQIGSNNLCKLSPPLAAARTSFPFRKSSRPSSQILKKGFTPSHAVQILQALSERGLVYKSKRGGYCFAVPLLSRFIHRQVWDPASLQGPVSSSGPLLHS